MRSDLSRVFDICLAAAVTGAGLAEVWVPFDSRQGDGSVAVTSVGVVALGALLAVRRVRPLPVALAVLAVWPALGVVAPLYVLFFGQFLPMAMAVFTATRYGERRAPYVAAGAAGAALLVADLTMPELQSPGEIFFHWFVFTVVWGFGFGLRRAEQRTRESTRRAIDAEVAAAEQAIAAVVEERTRIARELHDIVAHSVSVMVVQAGAAEQVVDEDPAFAREALGAIRATGTDALAEMRRVVAMLRDDDEPGALAPQPGIDALPGLVQDARTSGLDATLVVTGEVRPLPAGVDLAAFRIVQEALTNVRRHAAASTVRVSVDYGPEDLRLEVTDDGVGSPDPGRGAGHGLAGMRERVALYGGHLEAASAGGAGFVVSALLPVGAPP